MPAPPDQMAFDLPATSSAERAVRDVGEQHVHAQVAHEAHVVRVVDGVDPRLQAAPVRVGEQRARARRLRIVERRGHDAVASIATASAPGRSAASTERRVFSGAWPAAPPWPTISMVAGGGGGRRWTGGGARGKVAP